MRNIFFLLLTILFASCTERKTSGYVVGKEHIPAHTVVQYNVAMKRFLPRRVPNQWVVWVADSCGVNRYNIDEATFCRIKHGEFLNIKGK